MLLLFLLYFTIINSLFTKRSTFLLLANKILIFFPTEII
jgi:hypothetical protein